MNYAEKKAEAAHLQEMYKEVDSITEALKKVPCSYPEWDIKTKRRREIQAKIRAAEDRIKHAESTNRIYRANAQILLPEYGSHE